MKMKLHLMFVLFILGTSCAGNNNESNKNIHINNEISKTIDLTVAFENIQTVKLSEMVDSVIFIPFETTRQSLMGQGQRNIKFSPIYIYYYGMYFDWNGKYGGTIIKKGQGPYEEVDGGTLAYNNHHFYSKGAKFIEYDITGKPTGKVRNLYASREFGENDFLRGGIDFSSIEENFVIYNYPSTIYIIDRAFETVYSKVVTEVDSLLFIADRIGNSKHISYYKDNVLFYNFMNDTIFYVTNSGLNPQWIVSLDDKLKLSTYVHLNIRKLLRDAMLAMGSGNSIENTELIKLTDNKHKVTEVYETESYLFFVMTEIVMLPAPRNKQLTEPYLIYFDKKTGKTIRVNKGFEDDILGMDFFFPHLGIYDEKLITFIWPFELFEYIEKCNSRGREVNPQLIELSKKIEPDDNPVLILVHLKKNA